MRQKRSTNEMMRAAIGFRAHSGWTAFVVIAGAARSPTVLARGRIELVETEARWFKQPYHAAAGMEIGEAKAFLRRCEKGASLLARRALRQIADDQRTKGHDLIACGIVLGSGRPLPALAATLASHALIHTAEGVLFREALVRASEDCALPVTGVSERELYDRGADELRLPTNKLRRCLDDMGKAIGPPWRQDEKSSALVAWLALAGRAAR